VISFALTHASNALSSSVYSNLFGLPCAFGGAGLVIAGVGACVGFGSNSSINKLPALFCTHSASIILHSEPRGRLFLSAIFVSCLSKLSGSLRLSVAVLYAFRIIQSFSCMLMYAQCRLSVLQKPLIRMTSVTSMYSNV